MAFAVYLLRVGSYEIDGTKFINWSKYNVTRNIQDLDSYRDASGVLHRNAVDHVPLKVEFETRENLTNADMAEFFGNINSNLDAKERKATVTVYVPELDAYETQEMLQYMFLS